jgi:hypothetical protein
MFAGSSIVCRMGHAGAGRRKMDIHAGRRVGEIRGMGPKRRERLTWEEWVWWLASCSSTRLQSARAAVHESVRERVSVHVGGVATRVCAVWQSRGGPAARLPGRGGCGGGGAALLRLTGWQMLEPTVPPTAVRTEDELRNRRSIFNCPRDVVPPAAFVLTCEKHKQRCHQAPRSKTLGQCAAEGDSMSSDRCPS